MDSSAKHKRREKKSETIEVRVSYSEKLAFMEACKQAGTTASQAIRSYIGDVLSPTSRSERQVSQIAAGIVMLLLVAALGLMFLTKGNAPATAADRVMAALDTNGDGVITLGDGDEKLDQNTVRWLIESTDQNSDGRVTREEVNSIANVTVELRGHQSGEAENAGNNIIIVPPGLSEAERDAFLERAAGKHQISSADMKRLMRLIEAVSVDAENNTGNQPDN